MLIVLSPTKMQEDKVIVIRIHVTFIESFGLRLEIFTSSSGCDAFVLCIVLCTGPEEDLPRTMDCFEFVCHAPSEYFKAKSSPYPTVSPQPELGYVWSNMGANILPVPSNEELYGLKSVKDEAKTETLREKKEKEKTEKTAKKEKKDTGKDKRDAGKERRDSAKEKREKERKETKARPKADPVPFT